MEAKAIAYGVKRSSFFVMTGLVPVIHAFIVTAAALRHFYGMSGWVYIMTNRPNGTLYVGVTSDLARRAWEHREGMTGGFTKRYRLNLLVFAEYHNDIRTAIQREKTLKHSPRAWKVRLILAANPNWNDLYDQLA